MKNHLICLPAVALVFLAPFVGAAKETSLPSETKEDSPLSPEAEIRTLIDQGKLDEASSLLQNIEGNDYAIACFNGIIALKRENPQEAIAHFLRAARIDDSKPELFLFLSQAYHKAGDLQSTLNSLEKGEPAGRNHASYYLFRGRIELELELHEKAFNTLETGLKRFPNESEFHRDLAMILIRSGLYVAAVEHAKHFIQKAPNDKESFLVIAHALAQAKRPKEAAVVLENAKCRFGPTPEIMSGLGHTYAAANRRFAAARAFEQAARLDPVHAFDAAEHFASIGLFRKAAEMNLLVQEQQKRHSIRLSIFLKQNRFERAVVVGEEMRRNSLLKDRDRYALAFAYVAIGRYDAATILFEEISDPKWKPLAAEQLERAGSHYSH